MMENQEILQALASILSGAKNKTEEKSAKLKVKVVADDKGLRVRPYESNPELGYVQVQEVEIANSSLTWKRRRKRTALVKGNVDVLQDWLAEYKGATLPGKIVIQEFLEDEIPDNIRREFFPSEDSANFDDIYESYVKRAGDDGVELMSDDQRIFRFQIYDEFDELEDIFVKHENSDQVRQAARERRVKALEDAKKAAELEAKAKEATDKADAKAKKEEVVAEGDQPKLD